MSAPMTKAELFTLFPANGSHETEEARGRFLSALRLGQALALPGRLLAQFKAWNTRRQTMLALETLPDGMLRDIGLTRTEIAHVADAASARAVPRPVPAAPRRLQRV
jgi:uncharacterized protein YjiS (DUF1127 family)